MQNFRKSLVSSLTSTDSPEINFAFMPVLFLKRSSHPFEALNCSQETSRASAILIVKCIRSADESVSTPGEWETSVNGVGVPCWIKRDLFRTLWLA